jgi:hypothetical protein
MKAITKLDVIRDLLIEIDDDLSQIELCTTFNASDFVQSIDKIIKEIDSAI